jgi:hypothetical protein
MAWRAAAQLGSKQRQARGDLRVARLVSAGKQPAPGKPVAPSVKVAAQRGRIGLDQRTVSFDYPLRRSALIRLALAFAFHDGHRHVETAAPSPLPTFSWGRIRSISVTSYRVSQQRCPPLDFFFGGRRWLGAV